MFSVDTSVRHIAVQRGVVVALYASLNKPHLAVPGKTAQEAQAFICGVRNANATFSIYVSLYLTATHEMVHYTDSDRPEVAAAQFRDAEADAVGFVESMGFMIEDLGFRNLPPDQQDQLIKTLPPFVTDVKATARPAASQPEGAGEGATPAVKLARLLAAF